MPSTPNKRKAGSKAAPRADQLRPLNLPRQVSVELDDAGLPSRVVNFCGSTTSMLGDSTTDEQQIEATASRGTRKRVETIVEVWHVDDEWWREPISRRYVEVILGGGKHVVLYEDLTTGGWFMQMP